LDSPPVSEYGTRLEAGNDKGEKEGGYLPTSRSPRDLAMTDYKMGAGIIKGKGGTLDAPLFRITKAIEIILRTRR